MVIVASFVGGMVCCVATNLMPGGLAADVGCFRDGLPRDRGGSSLWGTSRILHIQFPFQFVRRCHSLSNQTQRRQKGCRANHHMVWLGTKPQFPQLVLFFIQACPARGVSSLLVFGKIQPSAILGSAVGFVALSTFGFEGLTDWLSLLARLERG